MELCKKESEAIQKEIREKEIERRAEEQGENRKVPEGWFKKTSEPLNVAEERQKCYLVYSEFRSQYEKMIPEFFKRKCRDTQRLFEKAIFTELPEDIRKGLSDLTE